MKADVVISIAKRKQRVKAFLQLGWRKTEKSMQHIAKPESSGSIDINCGSIVGLSRIFRTCVGPASGATSTS
jgi:uncharacterized protein involved in tellurium resistance